MTLQGGICLAVYHKGMANVLWNLGQANLFPSLYKKILSRDFHPG
jgi:hypothetical protein